MDVDHLTRKQYDHIDVVFHIDNSKQYTKYKPIFFPIRVVCMD